MDRIFRPLGVVDFIDVEFYGLFGLDRWPTFNVADAALSVSVIVLILFYSRQLAANENGDTPTPSNDNDDTTAATT